MRSIDPYLLSKINSQNQTIYNNANPKMSIQVSRAKSTVMDNTYWTVETIRTKEGLGDLSIAARRFRPYGSPNRLYNIYVDNGVVKTAIREYPDYLKEKWQNQFELGNGSAVAIAFDGHWEMYRKKWQLVTVDDPYLFWVDNIGKLYTQLWDDVETKVELATNVKRVKALRGWKNINFADKDHGVIVAYIKNNGKVYYRNYCSQADGSIIWETERELIEFTGIAVNLNLFITNDYRTGFVIEDSLGKIHWFITSRNWAGMAIAPDKFKVMANVKIDFIETNKIRAVHDEYFVVTSYADISLLYGSAFNEFIGIGNINDGNGDYGKIIKLIAKYKMFELNPLDFVMVDGNGIVFNCISVMELEGSTNYNWQYELEFNNFNNAKDGLNLTFKGLYAKNEAGNKFDSIIKSFEPINLVPSEVPAPNVVSIVNDGDKYILIEFDNPIVGEVGASLSAFTITSKYFKDTFEEIELTEIHPITLVSQANDTTIQITLKYPQNRIRRANEMVVEYNSILGSIAGESYPLESFEETFIPNITKLLDPVIREKFVINANGMVDFNKVIYSDIYMQEKFTVTANCIIDFKYVGIVNP